MNAEKQPHEDASEELFEHHRYVVDAKQGPLRIDRFLTDRLANTTRNKVQQAIIDGYVRANGAEINSNYKIKPGDEITVSLPEPPRDTDVIPQDIPLDIRYEDEDLMVVYKPAGMVVHPAYANWEGTLVNALAFHFKNLPTSEGNEGRPGLVHRIDKDTSGLLVIAKSEIALTHLAKQFFHKKSERTYWALVWGEPKEPEGTIDIPIGRSAKDRRIMDVFPEGEYGKEAITHYKTLRGFHYVSLVEFKLETGRTHQIRIHAKYLGHPLFNDDWYGGKAILKGTVTTKYKQFVQNCFDLIPGQALHAKTLGFLHPTKKEFMQFDSELPEGFVKILEKWERYTASHD